MNFFSLWFIRSCWRRGSGWRLRGNECRPNWSTSGSVWPCLLCSYTEVTIKDRPRGDPSHPRPHTIRDLGDYHPVPHLRLRAQSCTEGWGWGGEQDEDEAEFTAQQEDGLQPFPLVYQRQERRSVAAKQWGRPPSIPVLDFCVLEMTKSNSYNQKKHKKNHLAAVQLDWSIRWRHTRSSSHPSSTSLSLHFNCS